MASLAPRLEERYEMYYFIPSRLEPFLLEKLASFTFHPLPYFSYVKKEDRIEWIPTAFNTVPQLLNFGNEVDQLVHVLKRLQIHAVLSDYDPYLAWAGKKAGIPVLQVNHPGIIARFFPLHPAGWVPALVSLFLEGPWTERIHVSFFQGDVGPLFRSSLFQYPVRDEGYLLVNVKPSYREPVLQVLKRLPGIPYKLFPSRIENFENSLARCRAVLSSAGHQIIAEAMVLGKPILVIPQKGQWEQQLNARMLHRTRRGTLTTLSRLKKDLPLFWDSLEEYPNTGILPEGYTVEDGTETLMQKIEGFLTRHVLVTCPASPPISTRKPSFPVFLPANRNRTGIKWAPLFPPPHQSAR